MPTAEGEASATPTSTATATPTPSPSGADWRFENVYTYYDDEFQKFYVWGEVVNNTGSDQRLITLWPVIYDADRNPITSKEDVNAVGKGYKELREMVSLAPGLSLPFSFLVYLPDGVSVEDNYEILLEAEEAGSARGDLDILQDYSDASDWPDYFYADWPDYFYVEGIYENPGPDLTAYVALVVTLYDEEGHVIGLGWSLEEDAPYLTSGEHDFEVEVEMWGIASELRFEAYTCKMQIFGY
jgi:hypothetical protein